MSVGKNIKRLRLLKGMKQKELGDKLGVSDKTVHKSMYVCQNCGYNWQSTKKEQKKFATA